MLAGCGKKTLDQSQPENVVAWLFEVVKADDPKLLAGLCDPQGEGDGDTRRICELSTQSPVSDGFMDFKEIFKEGGVDGKAEVMGDEARVSFHFGEGGKENETMELIRRGDKWYLSGF